jgi:hypothetical protein
LSGIDGDAHTGRWKYSKLKKSRRRGEMGHCGEVL